MGYGLILAGLGKGISEAGSAMGSAAMEDAREKRLMDRTVALDDIREKNKEAREEKLRQKNISDVEKAGQMADEIAAQRTENKRLQTEAAAKREDEQIAGAASKVVQNNESGNVVTNTKTKKPISQSPSASEEEIAALMKSNPQAYGLYEKAGLINRNTINGPAMPEQNRDPRLQRVDDEYSSAVKIGAHSSTLESLDKKRQRTLEEIRVENADKKEENRTAEQRRRDDLALSVEERRTRETQSLITYRDRSAGAQETRAAKSGGSSAKVRSTYTDDAGNKIAVMSDGETKVLGRAGDFDKKVADLVLKMGKEDYNFNKLPAEEKRAKATELLTGNNAAGSSPKATVSDLPKGAKQIGTSGGKPVYQTPDGKKFIGQ